MLCLLGNAFQLRPLSSVPCLIHFSFVLCPMYFLSHVFCISFILHSIPFASHLFWCLFCFMSPLRSCLKFQAAQAAQTLSQHSDRVSNYDLIQATSRNQLCLTGIEIGDSWKIKMYIEREAILYSFELWDKSLMRSVTFNPYVDADFCLSLWQVIKLGRHLLAYELCVQILLSLNSTLDLGSQTFDQWPTATSTWDFWLDLWYLTFNLWLNLSSLTFDFQLLTNGHVDLQPLTQILICDLRSSAFNQPFFIVIIRSSILFSSFWELITVVEMSILSINFKGHIIISSEWEIWVLLRRHPAFGDM